MEHGQALPTGSDPWETCQLRGLPEDLVAFPHAGWDRPHRGPGPQPAVTWEGPAEDTGGVFVARGGSTFRTKRLPSIGEEEAGILDQRRPTQRETWVGFADSGRKLKFERSFFPPVGHYFGKRSDRASNTHTQTPNGL